MLYKTKVEYGDYAMNYALGCSHGCKYPCYAYSIAKRFGKVKSYEEWIQPKIVSNTLELLNVEIPKYSSQIKSVQLCFSTDPFMVGHPEIENLSMDVISLLNRNRIKCVVLTKGILPHELTNYSVNNEYGITLTSLDEDYRKAMEPGSASAADRIAALQRIHNLGSKTWVSIEPYPTPDLVNQNILELLEAVSFADRIVFGQINYRKKNLADNERREFYRDCVEKVKDFCNLHQMDVLIKKGTEKA